MPTRPRNLRFAILAVDIAVVTILDDTPAAFSCVPAFMLL